MDGTVDWNAFELCALFATLLALRKAITLNNTLCNPPLACVQLQTFTQLYSAVCTLRSSTHFTQLYALYEAVCTLHSCAHFTQMYVLYADFTQFLRMLYAD